ncbi:probable RNA helicase SDE3 [Corylus avellana]|uniref:probable RNA helicase SDE3 n=1 Tax=Corylus avellana TaxID=13451 RepID=UPI00286A89A9|nr:probable RNA helicase SDE3 [Corylus avellana]
MDDVNPLLKFLQCILCCHVERHDDNDDLTCCIKPFREYFRANSRNRNPEYEYLPVDTTPPSSPRPRVTLSAPFCQPIVGDSPTFSYRPSQSSYKPPQSSYSPSPSSSKSATSSSEPSPAFPNALLSSSKPSQSISKPNLPPSSFSPSASSPTYSKPPQSSPSLAPSSANPLPSAPKPASSHKPSLSSPKELPYSSGPSPFPHNGPPSSSRPPPSSPSQSPAFKPILYMAPSDEINGETKTSYVWEKGSPIYAIPEDIKGLIKKDIVPAVLKQPLSPSTYKHYFAALLYAEDFYFEKWSDFQLQNVILELQEAQIYKRSNEYKNYNRNVEKDDKIFVVFEIDSVPEKRPFLLSRDLVYARPSGKTVEPFKGLIYRVVKSTCVLVEFGDDFHSQHCSTRKYDISFSFNRVCLKRAHQAVEAASHPLLLNFLFPECISRKNILNPPVRAYQELGADQFSAVHRILSFRSSPPYLLCGSLSVNRANKSLSRTGVVVREAVFEAYKTFPDNRILVCAPINSTCDELNRSLKVEIPESDIFRANAAFREIDEVPIDILSSCIIERELFACPSLQHLRKYRIILSTFVSSFRLHNEGIAAGHFSHIFLVDASSTTEPEAMVALANFANDNTSVIVTGAPGDSSGWVRSDVGRKYGLRKSYFERLLELGPYRIPNNPMFITKLDDFDR